MASDGSGPQANGSGGVPAAADLEEQRKRRERRIGLTLLLLLILLFILGYCCAREDLREATPHPVATRARLLYLGDAVVTGFAGVRKPDPTKPLPDGKSAIDQTFIDTNGATARIFNPAKPAFIWDGSLWTVPRRLDIRARDVGHVFGVAIDGETYPNLYLSATSAFGLNLVLPDADRDRLPERTTRGSANAVWMAGQFGPKGGPGSIWRIDGETSEVSLLVNIEADGVGTGPASLGNLAYDPAHNQLFVTDLSSGLIHRISMGGRLLEHFDHGEDGRRAEGRDAVARGARPPSVRDEGFDTTDPASWGFADPQRRVFGIAVWRNRVYYAAREPREIWSIGLDEKGGFAGDPRLEIELPVTAEGAAAPEITDIVFSADGAMLLAERRAVTGAYDYAELVQSGPATVYRYWPEEPEDPRTKSRWIFAPEEHAIGFASDSRNGNGGIDVGYGYTQKGERDFDLCGEALWITGEDLRTFRLEDGKFIPDGDLVAHGVQVSSSGPVRGFNVPPRASYIIDFDERLTNDQVSGHTGGLRIYRTGCASAPVVCWEAPEGVRPRGPLVFPPAAGGPGGGGSGGGGSGGGGTDGSGGGGDGGGGGGGGGGGSCIPGTPECPFIIPICLPGDPDCTDTETGSQCVDVWGDMVCSPDEGGWVYRFDASDQVGMNANAATAISLTPGVTVSSLPMSLANPPASLSFAGANPGDVVAVEICVFDQAKADSGEPYDCCRETILVRIPRGECLPEGEDAP
ncbi:MAG TPA: hypothetical protein PL096_03010 [Micropepsaceae bacterium]|nr:hypothetical protein [Micropepsaceae bacterium]